MEFSSKHVFVIAEAGSNWKCGTYEKDLEQAVTSDEVEKMSIENIKEIIVKSDILKKYKIDIG